MPELPAAGTTVSLATPADVLLTDAANIAPAVVPPADPMPVMAPSVLRVDDIRSEPFGWQPPESGPADDMAAFGAPEDAMQSAPDVLVESLAADADVEGAIAGIEPVEASHVAEGVDVPAVPVWVFDSEPEAAHVEDMPAPADAVPDMEADAAPSIEYRAPMLTPVYVHTVHDASSLVAEDVPSLDEETVVGEVTSAEWFEDPELHAVDSEDSAIELPVQSAWTDLPDEDVVTLETDVIPADGPGEVMAADSPAPWAEVAGDGEAPDPVSDDAGSDAVVVSAERAPAAAPVPDEWWSGTVGDAGDDVVSHPVPEPALTVMRRTPPVDGAEALDALVSETQGAERAVEALEAVARMIRSREIVVSVGAGASAESVLASILASLLSHPS